MNALTKGLVGGAFALLLPLVAIAAQPKPVADPVARATALLDHLDAGEFAAAEAMFTADMAQAVPADKLEGVWAALPQQAGAATGRGTPVAEVLGDMRVVTIPLHHANAELVARVAVRPDGRIAGFLVQPAPPPPAAGVDADAGFDEREFAVAGLPGTLAMPAAASAAEPVPAVVLVHGSGPHDRDETIGPNRPFLDIARGLAAEGIAVLRYEKRTRAHPEQFADGDYDVDEESTTDAVAAVAALGDVEGIDPGRIHVFGHSQGAMLAPRIARQSGNVAGLVMLAAPARRLLDLLPEQNRFVLGLDGDISIAEQGFLETLDTQIANARSGADVARTALPLGLPAVYWRSMDAVDPVADARGTDLPMLLLHGGRDIQVTDIDWQLWQSALEGASNATLRRYAALNHLGIPGDGPGTLTEYQQLGQVDAALIADVAAWIHAH